MMVFERDFYRGFEGEPEIEFVAVGPEGAEVGRVRIWGGYFDAILGTFKPGPTGWTGIALTYHLGEGWYETDSWVVPDLEGFLEDWKQADVGALRDEARAVHGAVVELLEIARERGAVVSVLSS